MRISDWSSDVCSSDLLETAKAALEKIGGLTVATNTAVVNSRGPRAKAAPAAAEPAAGGGDGDGDTLTHVDEGNVTAAPWATQASKADRKSTRLNSSH